MRRQGVLAGVGRPVAVGDLGWLGDCQRIGQPADRIPHIRPNAHGLGQRHPYRQVGPGRAALSARPGKLELVDEDGAVVGRVARVRDVERDHAGRPRGELGLGPQPGRGRIVGRPGRVGRRRPKDRVDADSIPVLVAGHRQAIDKGVEGVVELRADEFGKLLREKGEVHRHAGRRRRHRHGQGQPGVVAQPERVRAGVRLVGEEHVARAQVGEGRSVGGETRQGRRPRQGRSHPGLVNQVDFQRCTLQEGDVHAHRLRQVDGGRGDLGEVVVRPRPADPHDDAGDHVGA